MKQSFVSRLRFIVTVLVLTTGLASGQAWRDATITMTNGDTLRGQIEFTDPDVSTSVIRFRPDQNSPAVSYETDDVTFFKFASPPQQFETITAQITFYSRGVVKWGENPITGTDKINVFAEVIRKSPSVTLYSVFDMNREERFFIRKESTLTELMNVSYLVERDANTFRVKDARYEGQLRQLFIDCPAIKKKTYSYDVRSLGNAVEVYMNCKGEASAKSANQPYEKLSIGVFATWVAGTVEGELIGTAAIGGITSQLLSRKNQGNQFLWAEAGFGSLEALWTNLYFGLYTGTYIGSGKFQPLVNVGVTSLRGSLNAGLGVAYKKRVVLSGNANAYFLGDKTLLYTIKLTVFPKLRRNQSQKRP